MLSRYPSRRGAGQCLHSNDHIWISDRTLNNAFHRFFRIAPTNCMRYGSNTPGPLEARRRLAKRRMVGLAAPGAGPANFLGGMDFGALFEWREKPLDRYSWEPPNLTTKESVTHVHDTSNTPTGLSNSYLLPHTKSKDLSPSERLEKFAECTKQAKSLEDIRSLWHEYTREDDEKAAFSEKAFKVMGRKSCRFTDTIAFLQDEELNVREAQLIGKYMTRCAQIGVPTAALDTLFQVVKQKILLGASMESEVADIIDSLEVITWKVWGLSRFWKQEKALVRAYTAIWEGMVESSIKSWDKYDSKTLERFISGVILLRQKFLVKTWSDQQGRHVASSENENLKNTILERVRRDHPSLLGCLMPDLSSASEPLTSPFITVCKNLLSRCSRKEARNWILSVTKSLADEVWSHNLPHNASIALLNSWLHCLGNSPSLQGKSHVTNSLWNDLYRILGKRIPPARMSDHFKTLESVDVCKILLRHWFPHYMNQDNKNIDGKRRMTLIRTEYESSITEHVPRDPKWTQSTGPYRRLIRIWRRHHQPCGRATRHLIELTQELYGHDAVFSFCLRLRNESTNPPVHADVIMPAVYHLIIANPLKALKLFRASSSLPLSRVPELPIHLVKYGALTRWTTKSMFKRWEVKKRFPIRQSKMATFLRKPAPLSNTDAARMSKDDLLHRIALEFSFSSHRSAQKAFRDVNYIHKYLRNQNIRLQPDLSRAFVQAGIIRPLLNWQWVSTMRLRWILNIVEQLEGPNVAKEIDSTVYILRGKVLDYMRMRGERKRRYRRWLGSIARS